MNKLTSLVQAQGPGDVEPSYDAPWMNLLGDGADWIVGTVLYVIVILLVVGVLIWIGGKLGGSGRAQDVGVTFIIWVIVGAAVVGGGGAIISWASGLDIFS